jgi:hypothetical protein
MNTSSLTLSNAVILPVLLVVFCGGVLFAAVTGKPFSLSPTASALLALAAGMTACTLGGISQVAQSNHWASPVAILGSIIGAGILLYAAAAIFGFQLPLATSKPLALVVMGALIGLKLLVGVASYLFRLV